MKQSLFRKYSLLGQVGLWAILFLINLMDELPYAPFLEAFVYASNYTLMVVGVVYVHYFGVLPLYLKGHRWVYFAITWMVITCFILLYHFIDGLIPFDYEYDDDSSFWDSYAYDLLLLTLIVAVTSLYYFVEAWYHNIKKESLLKNEKLQAELNFLKSQINPHFLFNTLNNIYAYAQTGNQKTAPMLERLSSILRFMVYDCSEDRVALTNELNAVEDLLEIHKMKNSEQRNIDLTVNGVKGYHLIAPLIIVNLAENACKHSDAVSNPKGFIHICISVNDSDTCILDISNSVKKKALTNTKYQGVGLENIKKRLDLQYKKTYTIEEEMDTNRYHLKLSIPLERKR